MSARESILSGPLIRSQSPRLLGGKRLTSRLGGGLAVPLLIFLVTLGSAFGAFVVLPNHTPSAASDDQTPDDLMPLAQDDSLASWNPHVECSAERATIPY